MRRLETVVRGDHTHDPGRIAVMTDERSGRVRCRHPALAQYAADCALGGCFTMDGMGRLCGCITPHRLLRRRVGSGNRSDHCHPWPGSAYAGNQRQISVGGVAGRRELLDMSSVLRAGTDTELESCRRGRPIRRHGFSLHRKHASCRAAGDASRPSHAEPLDLRSVWLPSLRPPRGALPRMWHAVRSVTAERGNTVARQLDGRRNWGG